MIHRIAGRLDFRRMLLLVIVMAAVAVPLEFEVASVKPVQLSPGPYRANLGTARHGEVTLTNTTLSDCMRFAFGITNDSQDRRPNLDSGIVPYDGELDFRRPLLGVIAASLLLALPAAARVRFDLPDVLERGRSVQLRSYKNFSSSTAAYLSAISALAISINFWRRCR